MRREMVIQVGKQVFTTRTTSVRTALERARRRSRYSIHEPQLLEIREPKPLRRQALIDRVRALAGEGYSKAAIARIVNLPRETVRDWLLQ